IDAFGGDAIPVHLLTREAVQLYMSKLRPGGALLFNVSNKYVDVATVLAGEANALSLAAYTRTDVQVTAAEAGAGKFQSAWLGVGGEPGKPGGIPRQPGWA